MPWETGHYI